MIRKKIITCAIHWKHISSGFATVATKDGSEHVEPLRNRLSDKMEQESAKLEDFHAVVDWAYKIDPLRCISLHGVTERYISGQKSDTAGFVRILLDDLESRISVLFSRVTSCILAYQLL
ncbi:uncharacterized protein LOC116003965 [Ipomoea triloba]|uniref:uncharacterized protein LOC116003965 n=1 Tax=Ipomoea triloba TaxID=35885 RepID=UPI00125E52C4|nr:uncharacterized protein LOC116003965 [Ipomoea triloba]